MMIVKLEKDPENPENAILPLPEEIIGKFNLQEGDICHVTHLEGGCIEIKFERAEKHS